MPARRHNTWTEASAKGVSGCTTGAASTQPGTAAAPAAEAAELGSCSAAPERMSCRVSLEAALAACLLSPRLSILLQPCMLVTHAGLCLRVSKAAFLRFISLQAGRHVTCIEGLSKASRKTRTPCRECEHGSSSAEALTCLSCQTAQKFLSHPIPGSRCSPGSRLTRHPSCYLSCWYAGLISPLLGGGARH